MESKPLVSIVCYANYCRSPVAEALLATQSQIIDFDSYGIQPFLSKTLDPRSRNFLNTYGIDKIHTPKKITKAVISKSNLVLAMDHMVLKILNQKFSAHSSKIKLFTFQHRKILIEDPFKFNANDYLTLMLKLKKVCEELKFEFLR